MTQRQTITGEATGSGRTESFKSVALVKRREDITHEQYREHQLGTHAPLSHKLPGLITYEYFDFPPSAEGEDQPYDGMAVLEWESLAAFQEALASEQGAEALADLPNFLDPERMLTLTGPTMLWRDGLGS